MGKNIPQRNVSTRRTIRVVAIEDDPRYVAAAARALTFDSGMDWLGSAGDVASGCELLSSARPDVALIDLGLGTRVRHFIRVFRRN